MREKPINQASLHRTIQFLKNLKTVCDYDAPISLSTLVKEHGIASGTGSACFHEMIIETIGKNKFKWLPKMTNMAGDNSEEVFKHLALQIKDRLLHKNKKTIHTPINPDWATVITHLKEISDKLSISLQQNESVLKRIKTDIKGNDQDLFKVDDQRLYIAGQIASGIYSNTTINPLNEICNQKDTDDVNNYIVNLTDDLMNKLLKRGNDPIKIVNRITPISNEIIGVCSICNNAINGDTYYVVEVNDPSKPSEGKMFCKDHIPEGAKFSNQQFS